MNVAMSPEGQDKLERLIEKLRRLASTNHDPESNHREADEELLEYIGDERVTAAFVAIKRWYS